MKKIKYLSVLQAIIIMLEMCMTVSFADIDIDLIDYNLVMYVDGKISYVEGMQKVIDNIPYVSEEKVMMPAKFVFENLGYKVSGEDTFNARNDSTIVTIKDSNVYINEKESDIKAEVKNDIFYIESSIAEVVGFKRYADRNGLIVIYKNGGVEKADVKTLYDMGGIYLRPEEKSVRNGNTLRTTTSLSEAVEFAEDTVKEYGKQYPVHIFVHGGNYYFDETITLDKEVFSGKNTVFSISDFGDGEVIFTGAKEINEENFKMVEDAEELARLPKAARYKVAKLDLTKENIEKLEKNTEAFPFIYLNDIEQIQSRWPNDEWAKVKSIEGKTFGYEGENPGRWNQANDIRINGFFSADYFYMSSEVISVNAEKQTITLSDNQFTAGRTGARWYAANLLEEIDMPGEYFVDRDEMMLYFYPPYSLKDKTLEIVTFIDEEMIMADGVSGVDISGITFTKTGGTAISINGAENVTVKDCRFRYIQADYAISAANQTYDIIIHNNECYGLGGGLVYLKSGDIDTITSGNITVSNNWIASCGYLPRAIAGAIFSPRANSERNASCGITVKNNLIQDSNNVYAISTEGVNNSILYNEIINHGKNIDDGGCIYIGRAATLRGLNIGFNYIHYLNKEHSYGGLYNDDGYCGASWHHNICVDMNRSSIHGIGMDQEYLYNISYDCIYPALAGDRMVVNENSNKVYGDDGDMNRETQFVVENFSKYYEKEFPELSESVDRKPFFAPYNTIFFGNIGVNTGESTIRTQNFKTVELYGAKNIERADGEFSVIGLNGTNEGNPHYTNPEDIFVDINNQNFEIKPESEVAKLYPELLEIKMEDIGLKDTEILKVPENFRLKSPYNGETRLSTKELIFSWDSVQGASKYRLIVSKDRAFTQIVLDETIRENGNFNVYKTSQLSNNNIYYWKVEAIGIARQNPFVIENKGGVHTFKTAISNDVEKDTLKKTIASVNSFLNEIENFQNDEYSKEYIERLKAEVLKAQGVYDTVRVQNTIDETEEELYKLVRDSVYYKKVEFITLDDSFFKPASWTVSFGTVDNPESGVLRYSAMGKGGNATVNINDTNKILCFKIKMTSLQNKEYQGVYYKYNKNNKGYLCVFKDTFMEYQKVGLTLDTLPSEVLKENEWMDVQMGAVNTPLGVMQFFKVDERLVYLKLDDDVTQTREGGVFMIHGSSYSDTYIKKSDALPEKTDFYKEAIDVFNKPQSKEHLICALVGMGDVIGLNSDLYKAVDKTEIADAIYEKVINGNLSINSENINAYYDEVMKYALIAAYNQGKNEVIYKNNIELIYEDEIGYKELDLDGVTVYSFFKNSLKDMDKAEVNKKTAGGEYKSFEDIRKAFAENVIIFGINAFQTSFAADSGYVSELITQQNAEYVGLNIPWYFKASEEKRQQINLELCKKGGFENIKQIEDMINQFV